MSHTKGPWAIHPVSQTSVIGDNHVVAACGGYSDNMRDAQELYDELVSNARRIVACVNACAHIPLESLERGDQINLTTRAIFAERQRDELLAAARNLIEVKGRHHSEQAYKRLAEVVAKQSTTTE